MQRDFNIISNVPQTNSSVRLPGIQRQSDQKLFRNMSLNDIAKRGRTSTVFCDSGQKNSYAFQNENQNIQSTKSFNTMFQTKTFWNETTSNSNQLLPSSLINCTSKPYNIISNSKLRNNSSHITELRPVFKIGNKKKAIGEISDLGRLQHPNFHPDYKDYLTRDAKVFRKARGYCSNISDKGFMNGKVYPLFYKYRE